MVAKRDGVRTRDWEVKGEETKITEVNRKLRGGKDRSSESERGEGPRRRETKIIPTCLASLGIGLWSALPQIG